MNLSSRSDYYQLFIFSLMVAGSWVQTKRQTFHILYHLGLTLHSRKGCNALVQRSPNIFAESRITARLTVGARRELMTDSLYNI